MIANRNRGIIAITAAALICSALLRLGGGVTAAQALIAPELTPENCQQVAAGLLKELRAREQRLESSEEHIKTRLAELEVLENQQTARLQSLAKSEASLAALVSRSSVAAEEDLQRLTSVYEAMKPREAASLFVAMAPDFAAGFLGRMQPDSAAAVMSGMPADAAYLISVHLAGRNALAPKEPGNL